MTERTPAETTPPADDTTEAVLLAQLRATADAHGVYEAEQLGGVYDEQWSVWYAHHMAQALRASGYRLIRAEPGT